MADETLGRAEVTEVIVDLPTESLLTRPVPLSSKRLTAPVLKAIVTMLGLPATGSKEETLQMIEGKLGDEGHEAPNVQVAIVATEDPQILNLSLLAAEGTFLECALRRVEDTGPDGPHMEGPRDAEDREVPEGGDDHAPTLEEVQGQNRLLKEEVSAMNTKLESVNSRVKELWKANCSLAREFEEIVQAKDDEIAELKRQLAAKSTVTTPLRASAPVFVSGRVSVSESGSVGDVAGDLHETPTDDSFPVTTVATGVRRGKAPPVDSFSGEDESIRLDDWLPTFVRASTWNRWKEEDQLIQLAGHLRGRALQEWELIPCEDRKSYKAAVDALRERLDPGGKTLAIQDFRHASQRNDETVSDFIRRLERHYRVAYGRDGLGAETRNALMHSQLQEGLKLELMRASAVSGAGTYQALCLASKNEERRLAELRKRQQYKKSISNPPQTPATSVQTTKRPSERRPVPQEKPRCYNCDAIDHLMKDCKEPKSESKGKPAAKPSSATTKRQGGSSTKQVTTAEISEDPLEYLLSGSDEETVKNVELKDRGSEPKCATMLLQGVQATGLIDSGSDITIMGGELFKEVAITAKLRKRDLLRADKTPKTYDQKPFTLDGRMMLSIEFDGRSLTTPVYLKMNSPDGLLLSEGACRQFGIISYHPEVHPLREAKNQTNTESSATESKVPLVKVSLVRTVNLLPHQSIIAQVQCSERSATCLVEPTQCLEQETGVQVEATLIVTDSDGIANLVLSNSNGYSCHVNGGKTVGLFHTVSMVKPTLEQTPECDCLLPEPATVLAVMSKSERCKMLREAVGRPELLDSNETRRLHELLEEFHSAFSLEESERGETDLLEMEIHTGNATPRRVPARRMPLAVRQEVSRQLKKMQEDGVIQPSSSPWASPMVMVRKKDGSFRFCIDYRQLNEVTKLDTYPLPRVDDLLDQLGESRFVTTLDLASGYWQIRVAPGSQEKTAFVVPHGLYEFRVMPFGLSNAPAVFQRLMQKVLMGLNPEDGQAFVSVYIDDILIYSRTLEEHLSHLRLVLERIKSAGLKLKISKCAFVREEVEFLGHMLTPGGLKVNPRLVQSVSEFPTPTTLKEVRQFLGLCSYYRRFIHQFAAISQPLNKLTRKNVAFCWDDDCQKSFSTLKKCLTSAPVLAYPTLDKAFIVETDASILGLGAVLSQTQPDGLCHPVAYASRSLTAAERNYGVTELETLAVVWALSHFRSYLYGQEVTVRTDHSAVKAILNTPSLSGKHARWWTKVYGAGIKCLKIIHRSGKNNSNADALSRSPFSPAPKEGIGEAELQVSAVFSVPTPDCDLSQLLSAAELNEVSCVSFREEQLRDPQLYNLILYLEDSTLPKDDKAARKVILQSSLFTMAKTALCFIDSKKSYRVRVAVPKHLARTVLDLCHRDPSGGHFSANRTYKSLVSKWWWGGMYSDTEQFVKSCPECAIVSGTGHHQPPPLHPIPVKRPFQIIGVDIMDLPVTTRGNKHVIVFQDYLTKWPMVYPLPDQKTHRIARVLVDEIIPFYGVPECLLSDRGTNLLSHLMRDLCQMLGIKKLNTTAYHPECDGMVERFNRTLKSMLRKHAARFGKQWDQFLPGVLYAYRNTPHQSTGEHPLCSCLEPTCAPQQKQHTFLHQSWIGLFLRITGKKLSLHCPLPDPWQLSQYKKPSRYTRSTMTVKRDGDILESGIKYSFIFLLKIRGS